MKMRRVGALLLVIALIVGTLPSSPRAEVRASPLATAVFINEIHYDNVSTDVGEAIEVAGPAGTDLTGWSIVLYNGSGGAPYDTDALSGTIPDTCGGYGVVVMTYPLNGIQNGAPDGIALVDASSTVVQFLSYEGTFTAVGGPANGMTSTDIGVSQDGSGPVGYSLQLTGTGTSYEDFTWATEAPNTFGTCNTGQTFGTPVDSPPQVSTTVPASGATNINTGTTITLNFNESVDIASDAIEIECPAGVDLAFEDNLPLTGVSTLVVTPTTSLPYLSTCEVTASAAAITDRDGTADQLDGDRDGVAGDDYSFSFTTAASQACGDPATLISTIQGSGAASPEVGNVHTIEGIVVGDFQRAASDNYLSGFFVQEEDSDWDADPATSEGILVYEGSSSLLNVNVGDRVRLAGLVSEYFDMTRIQGLAYLTLCDTGLTATPTVVTLPFSTADDLERYEGMLVTFPQELTISEYFNFDRFGEIVLTTGRQFQPTAIYPPGSPEAAALATANGLARITLDDGRASSNPDPAIHPNGEVFTNTNLFRGGDLVQNVTGVLDYNFSAYKVQPTEGADYTAANPRPAGPEAVGGTVTVAAMNVLNYFTTLDLGPDICGPTGGQECRGADTAEEFDRQQAKIVAALCGMDADVVGMMEMENPNPANDPEPGDGISNYVLLSLVEALNAPDSGCINKTYTFVDDAAMGTDAIRQGLIYRRSTVSPVGPQVVLDDPAFTDPNNLGSQQNRPAIAQTFEHTGSGEQFTVVVNHLKSKGGTCGAGDDDPEQGSCNATRTAAAAYLANWLTTDPTGSGDPDFLIVGDLNAYDKEDPITALSSAGYTDLILQYAGEYAYSYLFSGQFGYLDHALANASLAPQVTNAVIWHINADEPDLIDYDMTFKRDAQDAIYAPDAYRAGDHDPVIVGLAFAPQTTITKTVTPADVFQNEVVTYTVTLANTGTAPDTVTMTDTLPSGVTFAYWVRQNGATNAGDEITWTGILGKGRSVTVTFAATNTIGVAGPVTNTAYFSGTESTGSAEASFAVSLRVPRVTLTKDVAPVAPTFMATVTYTLELANTGTLSDVVTVTDTLPSEVLFARWVDQPTGATLDQGQIRWTGTVTAGTTLTFTYVVTNTAVQAAVSNTAYFSGTLQAGSDTAVYQASGAKLYLPLIMQAYTP